MAYAVITSIMTTIEQVLQFNPSLISECRESVDSLYGTLSFLQAFLEDTGKQISDQEALKFLEEKIRDAGYKAEDTIDLCLRRIHVADSEKVQDNARCKLYDGLLQIIEVMDSIQGEVMKFKNDQHNNQQDIKDLSAITSSPLRSSGRVLDEENSIVGMEDDFNIIRDQLFGQTPELNVVSIVGKGGIGKSTLARSLFNHPSVSRRFDISSWVTVSQAYDAKEMLLDVLSFGTSGGKAMYRDMSEDCPLLVVVIAGLLSKINRTYDDWQQIADNVNSHVGSTSQQCLAILALSYNYLPCSLKACFLYMGVFLEDADISADKLIRNLEYGLLKVF